jgi:polysaccharide biosynthesis/export protein
MRCRTKPVLFGLSVLLLSMVAALHAVAQQPSELASKVIATQRFPHYILGPNDEIIILALDAEEIANKPIRVTTSGDINLPLVGRIHVAGMTLEDLEKELTERLKVYLKQPQVAINVVQFKSQPVSVFGAVGSPGVVQLEGRKTLFEVLAQAGGVRQDAGNRIKVTRRTEWGPIPLASAKTNGEFSIAEVNIKSIQEATRPEDNIQILPNDVITVPRAEVVYVMGEVRQPGGFALNDRDSISLLEVLARAQGLGVTAARKSAKIIRPVPDSNRIEIPVNLSDVLSGKAKDVMLKPNDILFVPNSYAKGAARRTLDTVISLTTGMIIYH